MGDKRALDSLILASADGVSQVRAEAARALGKLGDRRAIDPLRTLMSDQFHSVQSSAFEALNELLPERELVSQYLSDVGHPWKEQDDRELSIPQEHESLTIDSVNGNSSGSTVREGRDNSLKDRQGRIPDWEDASRIPITNEDAAPDKKKHLNIEETATDHQSVEALFALSEPEGKFKRLAGKMRDDLNFGV